MESTIHGLEVIKESKRFEHCVVEFRRLYIAEIRVRDNVQDELTYSPLSCLEEGVVTARGFMDGISLGPHIIFGVISDCCVIDPWLLGVGKHFLVLGDVNGILLD